MENVAVTDGDIIPLFYPIDTVVRENDQLFIPVSERLIGMKVSRDLIDPQTREVLVAAGKKFNKTQPSRN